MLQLALNTGSILTCVVGRWDRLILAYTDSQGALALHSGICTLYETVSAEEVIVAAPQELINMAFHAMLRPGDHVISVFPGYQSLYEIARHIGCKVSFWEPEEQQDGGFAFNVSLAHIPLWSSECVLIASPEKPLQKAAAVLSWLPVTLWDGTAYWLQGVLSGARGAARSLM